MRLPCAWPDATALLGAMRRGELSALEAVQTHLDRLEGLQPHLNIATEFLREEALSLAAAPRPGPLSGLPFTLKEQFSIKGHEITMCSSRYAPTGPERRDAPVVARLKAAGAIPIARTNTSELTIGPESDNLRFGLTRNPLSPERTPGGSSGGEAAAVASGASAFGLGSDTGGSIRQPAHCCAIVGFKPTSASVPTRGTSPVLGGFSERFVAVGPLTRSVRDARLIYDAIANSPCSPSPRPLGALRLLISDDLPMAVRESCIREAWRGSCTSLRSAGMRAETVSLDAVAAAFWDYSTVILRDWSGPLAEVLGSGPGGAIMASRELWRRSVGRPTVTAYVLSLLIATKLGRRSVRATAEAQQRLVSLRERFVAMMGDDGILVLPTHGALAQPHGEPARRLLYPETRKLNQAQIFFNALDLPCISVPAYAHRDPDTGLVPGVSLASAPGAEGSLFVAAEALEAAMGPAS